MIKEKNTFIEAHHKVFLIGVMVLLGVFLVGNVSATEWDNIKSYNPETNTVTITNWLSLGNKLEEATLNSNTYNCLTECSATTSITLFDDGVLIKDLRFYRLYPDDKMVLEKPPRIYSLKYYIDIGTVIYKEIKTLGNGTVLYKPEVVYDGKNYAWRNYKLGTEVPVGTYQVKLEGTKKVNQIYDWQVNLQGKWIDDWATWGNISLGDDAEVVLIVPENRTVASIGDVISFNSTINITGGAGIQNISLYTNFGGTWGLNETKTFSLGSSLDEPHGVTQAATAIDITQLTGLKITMIGDSNLVNVTKSGLSTATTAYLYFDNGTLMDSELFVGDVAVFSSQPLLLNTEDYRICAGDGVSTYTRSYGDGAAGMPIVKTRFSYVSSSTEDADISQTNFYNIISVATTTGSPLPTNYAQNFSKVIDDKTLWNVQACDSDSDCGFANDNWTVLTLPSIYIFSPTNTSYATSTIFFNATANQTIDNWIVNYNGTNTTLSSINTTLEVEDGIDFHLLFYGNDTDGVLGLNDTIYFSVDASSPSVNITSPSGTYNHNSGDNLSLNWTVADISLSSCWYNFNETNTTVTCLDNGTYFVANNVSDTTITFYANDTFGNVNTTIISWGYKVWEYNNTYTTPVLEGSTTTFNINYNIGSGYSLSSSQLYYNSLYYTGTNTAGKSKVILTTPTVSADTNVTFNWILGISDLTQYNSSSNNQTVKNLNVDNCSVNSIMIFNFTMKDEETEVYLSGNADNTSIKIDLSLSTNTTSPVELVNFYQFYNEVIPARVCVNTSLGTSQYFIDSLIEYKALNKADEFYNLQRYNLNGTSNPYQNITLYDLNTSDNQPFRISYKDASYIPVEDALIEIQRKYVDQGVFKVIEIPKTDPYGETVGNLVLNDVIYNFIVKKNGEILDSFNNVRVVCQTPAISECILILNSFTNSIPITNYSSQSDFSYTLFHNRTSRTTYATFNIPSGTISVVKLNVSDGLGNNVCSQSITAASGTLSCNYLLTVKNQTMMAKIYKDNILVGTGQVDIGNTASQIYGGIMALLGIFIMITLIGVALTDNPVISIVFLMVGVILLFGMNLVTHTAFIGYGATILFLIIAIIMILIKAGKRQ